MRKKTKVIILVVVALALLLFCMPQIAHFATDYLWFAELGYQPVFLTFSFAKFAVGFVVFLLVFLVSYATLLVSTKYQPEVTVAGDNVVNVPNKKTGKRLLALIPSLGLGLFAGVLSATALWQNILLFLHQTPTGVTDPVFHRDVSFYFFDLSLLETAFGLIMLFLIVIFLFNLLLTLYLQGFRKQAFRLMGKRIVYFAVAFVLLLIVGFQLRAADLLYVQDGSFYGAGYTDLRVTLLMYYAASAACVLAAITMLVGMRKKSAKIFISGPVILVLILLVGTVASGVVESFVVKPAEIAREKPYIANNIDMTAKAYGLDNIVEVPFNADGTLTAADLEEDADTLKNIRLIDYRPTITVFNQMQSMRLYYKFVDVDIDRYDIDGVQQQVYLSARELDQNSLDSSAQTWVNQYLKYTHGYGAVVTPVNRITTQGQPEMWTQNIPPVSSVPELEITRPEIYYGQLTNDYVIVNTEEPEFDYPIGDTNAQTQYAGEGGIRMTLGNKLLFSLDRANYRILFSNLINSESRIMLHRNILDRVEKIAPFLTFDHDPYLVIDNGRLVWVIDAYTSSNKYPYAAPVTNTESTFYGQNYIRNSVKATVDAYDGKTNFYIVDATDPLAQSYSKVFPGLFQPLDAMPESLREHLKYSEALFEVQTEIYQQYHMKDPTVFYNKEDVWSIANEIYGNETSVMEPYFVNMRLPETAELNGSNELEFLLMRPFTPTQKQNMVSWLAARNDDEHYGQLVLFKFPKQSTIYGPMQVEARISNDSEISQNLNLWDQQGSSVIRSDLLVIPIQNSILYVEPIYLTTNNENSLPEVVRIVVSYKDRVVMARTLDEALTELFGSFESEASPGEPTSPPEGLTYNDVAQQLKAAYQSAKQAAQQGNWAEYGVYLDELEQLINQLDNASAGASNETLPEANPAEEPTVETEPGSENNAVENSGAPEPGTGSSEPVTNPDDVWASVTGGESDGGDAGSV